MRHGSWPRARRAALLLAWAAPAAAMAAVDLDALWDFRQPALSEQRFRAALATAEGDDALVLQTQIARTLGLRRDFDGARTLLRTLEPQLATAGAEARTRWALEWGRTHASATHPAEAVGAADREAASAAFTQALATARAAGLDALAIDAIHMFAFVETGPQAAERRARDALALATSSAQPAARRWEPSIRHNLGVALNTQGRHDEALAEFRRAAELRRAAGAAAETQRIAQWMVAHTLRRLGRHDEALAILLPQARELDAAGRRDRFVDEELEAVYRALGDTERAEHHAQRRAAAAKD